MVVTPITRQPTLVVTEKRETWYFTFGASTPFGYCYVAILDATHTEARDVIIDIFGNRWGMQYDSKGFDGQVDNYSLKELATLKKTKFGTWRPITIGGQPAV